MQQALVDHHIIKASGLPIISFSHFLPRIELIPEKRYLFYPHLAKTVGSCALQQRVERLRPTIHVFGHTHFGWDMTLDGIRYIQAALSYPRERDMRPGSLAIGGFPEDLLQIYDSEQGPSECISARWSDHYMEIGRDPDNRALLPWVIARWEKKKRRRKRQRQRQKGDGGHR